MISIIDNKGHCVECGDEGLCIATEEHGLLCLFCIEQGHELTDTQNVLKGYMESAQERIAAEVEEDAERIGLI